MARWVYRQDADAPDAADDDATVHILPRQPLLHRFTSTNTVPLKTLHRLPIDALLMQVLMHFTLTELPDTSRKGNVTGGWGQLHALMQAQQVRFPELAAL